MTQIIERDDVLDALRAADLDEDALREDYSGRGMYGGTCLGVVADAGQTSAFLAALGVAMGEMAIEIARSARTDSMGLSQIIYFPGYSVEAEDEDGELTRAKAYLRVELCYRVECDRGAGQSGRVTYVEAASKEDAAGTALEGRQRVISVRRATVDDAEEMLEVG